MTVLGYVIGVVLFTLAIGASIALHEVGHLVPSKRFGVRVPQFMVGFGPTVWSRHRGETEYGLKAVPLGGFVRMIGMYPPRKGDAPGTVRASSTGRFSQLAEEARAQSMEELRPGDENRVFYKLPVWQKLVIMLGGPLMNLAIGAALITLVVTVHGVPTEQPGATVERVYECVLPATTKDISRCPAGATPAPAMAAGMKPGDRYVSIDGRPVRSTGDVGTLIRPRIGKPTEVVVERAGTRHTLTLTPVRNVLPVYDDSGRPVTDAAGKPKTVQAGYMGVMSAPVVAYIPQPASEVPGMLGSVLGRVAHAVANIPDKLGNVWGAVFNGEKRDPEGLQSVVGAGRIAGEVVSGEHRTLMGMPIETPSDQAWVLVQMLASLNLMLFVFNLIPLMPFDGGQVAGALWEGVKRGWARLRGRTEPAYVDVAKALPVTYAVSALLIGTMVLLVWADLFNPINIWG